MLLDFALYPKQHAFVLSNKRFCALIGGIGTGKSRAVCIKAVLKAQRCPGSVGMITAPTYTMLRDATMRSFYEICPPELIAWRMDAHPPSVGLYTSTGAISEILFRSTHEPEFLRGPNLLHVHMDEAAMSDKEAFDIIIGRLRALPEEEQQLSVASTPKGFNWVYDKFGPHQTDPSFFSIFVETKENIFLPPSYVDSLYKQYEGTFKQQELLGQFVAYEGLVYGDLFDHKEHVGDFPFVEDLPVTLAWDFGYPKPECCLAIQMDGYNHVYVIDEIYHLKTLTEDIVAEAKGRPWFRNVNDVVCDDARPDLILRLRNLGLPARPARKGKILDGIKLVRTLLAKDKTSGRPILHIDRRCAMLQKEFGLWRWKDKNPQTDEFPDQPVDAHNHALDALRYFVVAKWQAPSSALQGEPKRPPRRVMAYQRMYATSSFYDRRRP